MPFTKVGKDKYVSPSGRTFNSAQVRLYYAHGGSFPGEKKKPKQKPHQSQYVPLSMAPPGNEE